VLIDSLIQPLAGALAAAPPAGAGDAASLEVQSVWDFVVKGGPMMIPIGLASLVALGVAAERLLSVRRRNVVPGDFMPGLHERFSAQSADVRAALDYCDHHDTPVARVIGAGLKRLGQPLEVIERSINEAGEREAVKLRKNMRALAVVASIAPLMGLLGTIFGMISAFQTVAVSGEALGKTELLAGGIYEAMITTAAGLLVGIPALLLHHWVSARVDKVVFELDASAVDFVESTLQPGEPDARAGGARTTDAAMPAADQPGPNGVAPGVTTAPAAREASEASA